MAKVTEILLGFIVIVAISMVPVSGDKFDTYFCKSLDGFTQADYDGVWYIYAMYTNTEFECISFEYDGEEFYMEYMTASKVYNEHGEYFIQEDNAEYRIVMDNSNNNIEDLAGYEAHTFVEGEYDKYALVRGCTNKVTAREDQKTWLLTRKREPADTTILDAIVARDNMVKINQANCQCAPIADKRRMNNLGEWIAFDEGGVTKVYQCLDSGAEGYTLKTSQTKVLWDKANQDCIDEFSGELWGAYSAEERDTVLDFLKKVTNEFHWVDLSRRKSDGKFVWGSGLEQNGKANENGWSKNARITNDYYTYSALNPITNGLQVFEKTDKYKSVCKLTN